MIHFAYVAFMAGAAAVAIPLILHFLRTRPTEREAFPSFMFLGASAKRAQDRNRLRKWLVLILRLLTILFLAMAFSWPFIPAFDERPEEATALIWDASLSMQAKPYAAEMRSRAKEAIAKAGPASPMLLGAVSRGIAWSGKFSSSPAELNAWFDRNATSNCASSFAYALAIADARLKDVDAKKRRITVFTDRQALPWKDLTLEPLLSPGVELTVELPKKPGFKNAAITRVKTVSSFTAANAQVGIEVELANYANEQADGDLDIYVDDLRKETRKAVLKPFETASFHFTLRPEKLEPAACRAEFLFDDELPQDNVKHFSLEPGKAPFVLATPGAGKDDFIEIAFSPAAASSAADFKVARGAEFRSLLPKASLAIAREGLDDASADAFQKYLENGGSGAILWRNAPDMRKLLLRFGTKSSAKPKKAAVGFGEIDFDNPLFKDFMEAKIGGLFDLRFFNPGTLEPPDSARPVASFKDGRPAIYETPCGRGKLIVIASQMDRGSTDWPLAPSFLPFWREVLASASRQDGLKRDAELLEIQAGAPTELRTPEGKPLDTKAPGCFKVSLDGRPAYASVNVPPEESNPSQLAASFDFAKLLASKDAKAGAETSKTAKTPPALAAALEKGTPLWRWFLAFALLFALCELAISNRTAL